MNKIAEIKIEDKPTKEHNLQVYVRFAEPVTREEATKLVEEAIENNLFNAVGDIHG